MIGSFALIGTSACALAVPWLLGITIEAIRGPRPAATVPPLALGMVGFALAQAAIRIVSRMALFNTARKAEYDLRSDLFIHLLRQSPSFFRRHPVGDVMSRLTADVQTVRAMWGPGILNIVNTSFLFTAAVALMFAIDARLALLSLLPYPVMFLFGRFFAARLYRSSRAVQDYLGDVSASLQEDLGGINVIKAYAMEPARKQRFTGMSDVLLQRNMQVTLVRGQLVPVLSGLGSLGAVVVLYFGGTRVIHGDITLGQLVQLNAYLALLVWPTLALGWMLSLFQRGYASWQRLATLLDAEPSVLDGPDEPAERPRGDLELRGLTVEIDGRRLLDDVYLRFPAGTVTALVGRTGAGKSLLVDAIPRLLEAPPAAIFLDGRDITSLPLAALRRAIGYAPQEAFLFSTSIARNIAFGLEHGAGNDATAVPSDARFDDLPAPLRTAIQRAAAAAGLNRDLAALPAGLDTTVGERGITLSGGQRQRVALARALAADPRVLILDDSLSSVDTQTEREILAELDTIMHGRTTILISHRVAVIRRADQIVVLDGGAVAEIGCHDELLARGGVYAELYQTELEAELEPPEAP
jgi:ATP-binding cassette subfamily B protein